MLYPSHPIQQITGSDGSINTLHVQLIRTIFSLKLEAALSVKRSRKPYSGYHDKCFIVRGTDSQWWSVDAARFIQEENVTEWLMFDFDLWLNDEIHEQKLNLFNIEEGWLIQVIKLGLQIHSGYEIHHWRQAIIYRVLCPSADTEFLNDSARPNIFLTQLQTPPFHSVALYRMRVYINCQLKTCCMLHEGSNVSRISQPVDWSTKYRLMQIYW